MVVGEEGTNGGLWCSPFANTSRPISSALRAIATIALMRSCSVGVRPVVGSVVTSPTVKIPNCMAAPAVLVPGTTGPLRRSIYLNLQLHTGERIFRELPSAPPGRRSASHPRLTARSRDAQHLRRQVNPFQDGEKSKSPNARPAVARGQLQLYLSNQ